MSMPSQRIIIRHPRKREPVLWLVDSEQWPRACLRAELIERGYDCYGFITIADALNSLSRGKSPKPEAIILELRAQNVNHQLIESIWDLKTPTILLGGGPELNDDVIRSHTWSVVLKRPFSLGTIADLVQKLVPGTPLLSYEG